MPEDTRKKFSSQGILWKTDRNATHDGPGIRTALYFKGCPLKCKWCSNPEGQFPHPILIFHKSKCTDCKICIDVCPVHALEHRGSSEIHIHRSRCDHCGDCVSRCPTEALQIWGQSYTVPEALQLLEKDRMIHSRSGGGVTCTGGDPLDQGEFLLELLEECRRRGIHTAVETSAYAYEELFKRVLQQVDLLFIDIKHIDRQRHLDLTGKNNDLIRANSRLASQVVADLYGLDRLQDKIKIIKRVRFLGEIPAAFTINYLPLSIGSRIRKEVLYRMPLLQIFKEKLNIPLGEALQSIEASVADHEIAEALEVSPGTQILLMQRTFLTKQGKPFDFVQTFYRGDKIRYFIRLRYNEKNGNLLLTN